MSTSSDTPRDDRDRDSDAIDWSRAGTAAAGWVGRMLGRSVRHVAGVARDARKAFEQGRDPRYEDAVILEEYPRGSSAETDRSASDTEPRGE